MSFILFSSCAFGLLLCGLVGYILNLRRRSELLLQTVDRNQRHFKGCLDQARRALFALEDQTNLLLEWGPEAVVIHRRGSILYLNQTALTMFQVPLEVSLLGTSLLNLVHSDCRDQETERWLHLTRSHEPGEVYEAQYLRLDGLEMLVQVLHRQVRLAGEDALQSYFRDITREREDALKLKRLNREHKTLTGAIERHSLVVKMSTNGLMTHVNDAFVVLCGYASEQLLGKPYEFLLAAVQDESVWKAMWTQISSGRAWSGELCLQRRNGVQKWVSVLVSPFFSEFGAIENYTILLTDITEFVQAKQLARDRLLGAAA